jgi:DNA polymerase IV
MPAHPRVILHVDMDAFYAAVEVREDPRLAGRPLIIGHKGTRGVVLTCSYEARPYGVRSAMPSVTAMRLCPQATWRPGRMQIYASVSRQIRTIFDRFTPRVEPVSIDEAFLDLTGAVADLQAGVVAARRLKDEIHAEQRLSASVGIAETKFLAKVASDLEKPDGLVLFPLEEVPRRLWPLPVERLWGVGPKSAARLHALGYGKIRDLIDAGESVLAGALGERFARHLLALSRGEDARAVEKHRLSRSISEERTYGRDLKSDEAIEAEILKRSEGVARELRREHLSARTVHIKVRTPDFTTWTRAVTLTAPTFLTEEIYGAARSLYRARIRLGGKGVRLLGVGVTQLAPEGGGQLDLFADPILERSARAARASDRLEEKYGVPVVTRARLLERPPRRKAVNASPRRGTRA